MLLCGPSEVVYKPSRPTLLPIPPLKYPLIPKTSPQNAYVLPAIQNPLSCFSVIHFSSIQKQNPRHLCPPFLHSDTQIPLVLSRECIKSPIRTVYVLLR